MDLGMVFALVGGLAALTAGAEVLVRGASRLAGAFGLSPLIIGLTVVAFGTSAPEAAVSLDGALAGGAAADVAVGNVVGSNVFNVLFILGACALVAPLAVTSRLVRVDVPILIVITGAAWLLASDGRVRPWEGGILVLALAIHTAWLVRNGRREEARRKAAEAAPEGPRPTRARMLLDGVLVLVGLALLVVGADWFVGGATQLARQLGLSELVIGLTIVAAGTSLPEVATSLVASFRGERDIAVGNVVGSNLFNLLGVLGLSSAVADGGLRVPEAALSFDLPVMFAATLACLPVFASARRIDRWEGGIFLALYVAYVAWMLMASLDDAVTRGFGMTMLVLVLPLVALTIFASWFRDARRTRV